MNRNEDLIELYHHIIEESEPCTSRRRASYSRSRSSSLHLIRSRSMSMQRDEIQRNFTPLEEDDSTSVQLEDHANEIVRRMEEDDALMEDNPISEQMRMETLRDMPQCLTLKRSIKAKLTKSVSKKSKHRPLGFFKRCKYQISITFEKLHTEVKNIIYSFELWYSSLKAIEGHFGSGVATYFKFLRWIFVMNFLISIPTLIFLFLPQIVHSQPESTAVPFGNQTRSKNEINNTDISFYFSDIITGEGYFTDTALFYGYYTNISISLIAGASYSMPAAYFFTMLSLYVTAFVVLSISVAKSYRRSFIETSGGLKNVYAHKVFCGWDYSIATKEGADLKSAAIFNEIKELLSDGGESKSRIVKFLPKFWTKCIQGAIHLFIILLLGGIAFLMWRLLQTHRGSIDSDDDSLESPTFITALFVTIIMTVGPIFFTWIIQFEDYKNPRTALYVSLCRTFLLEIVVIGVLVIFWLKNESLSRHQCWETSLGQEVYRLIFIDFIISTIFTSLIEFIRLFIYKYITPKIGMSEFDIARHTLQIIYTQTLFWVGFYFAPLLCVVVTLKFWFTWYVKRLSCLHCCKPSAKSWRAAQTQTIFLGMTFIALFIVVFIHGFIITSKQTSENCGPFKSYVYMYEMILKGLLQLQNNHGFMKFLMYLTKPGVIALLLIAMGVRVYYLRAKSNAQRSMVELLREMLVIEAKDKEFLLTSISKVTEGTWIYNLNRNNKYNISQRSNNIIRRLPRYDLHDEAFSQVDSRRGAEINSSR